jgi:GNAT superfamily N-acetyltransferase
MSVPSIQILEITPDRFYLYDAIANHFRVETVFRVQVVGGGLGGFRLVEEAVAEPYIKDYGGNERDNPSCWAECYDASAWGIFLAIQDGQPLGGAALAVDAPVYPLDRFQRSDLIVLWDIRVHPDKRGRGIGAALFRHAADWARVRGYGQLGLETSSVNVPACRFYAAQGCELGAIHRYGYAGCPDVAHEAMLLWYLEL